MLRPYGILYATLLALLSCNNPEKPPSANPPEIKPETAEVKTILQDASVLTLDESPEVLPFLDGYRFGKFFEDRAEFFVIRNPASQIFGSPVKTIVLYYLDERHCQSKFFLTGDISDELIARYGKFRIAPLDLENKKHIETGPVFMTEKNKTVLNKSLTRFELSWALTDKVVRFRVDLHGKGEEYIYTEHIPDYDQVFRAVEKASL